MRSSEFLLATLQIVPVLVQIRISYRFTVRLTSSMVHRTLVGRISNPGVETGPTILIGPEFDMQPRQGVIPFYSVLTG